jgi:hypothetical protein
MAMQRTAAPWDTLKYFATPTPNQVPTSGNTVQLCNANPNRVGLIIDRSSGTTGQVWIDPQTTNPIGIVLTDSRDALFLTFADWGPLVTQAWYGFSVATIFSVTEVLLNAWPGEGK